MNISKITEAFLNSVNNRFLFESKTRETSCRISGFIQGIFTSMIVESNEIGVRNIVSELNNTNIDIFFKDALNEAYNNIYKVPSYYQEEEEE